MNGFEIAGLVTGRNLSLALAAAVLTATARQLWPRVFQGRTGRRVLPVLPLILALAGSLAQLGDAATWADRIVLGILAGAVASYGYKLGRTTIFGVGLEEKPKRIEVQR